MRLSLVGLSLGLLLLTGCATTDVLMGQPLAPPTADQEQDVDLLVQLANNPLIAAVLADAADTQAWVDQQEKAGMDPVKVTLARACPTAAKYAATDFHEKVLALKARLDQLTGIGSGVASDLSKPHAILIATKIKYGQGPDLKGQIQKLRDDISLRLDALFTGCAHLFPKKQFNELVNLARKTGFLSTGVGILPVLLMP